MSARSLRDALVAVEDGAHRPPSLITRLATVKVRSFANVSKSETSRSLCIADIANLAERTATACRSENQRTRKSS